MPRMIKPQLEEFMRRMALSPSPSFPALAKPPVQTTLTIAFVRIPTFYLTGFEEPEAIAVVKPSEDDKYTLFVRPRDPERDLGRAARRCPKER